MPLIFQDFKLRFRPAPGTTVNLCCPGRSRFTSAMDNGQVNSRPVERDSLGRQVAAVCFSAFGGVLSAAGLTVVLVWGMAVMGFLVEFGLRLVGSSTMIDRTPAALRLALFPLACLLLPIPLAWWRVRADSHSHPAVVGLASAAIVSAVVVGLLWIMLQTGAAL